MLLLQKYLQSEVELLSIAPSKRPVEANPGTILKSLRKKNGWGLAEVSDKTGLPISTLSRLENGKMAMTFEKLKRISAGLAIDMSVLIGSSLASQRVEGGFRRSIVRAGEGQSVTTPTGAYLYVAADMLNKMVTPIIGFVTARSIDEYDEFLRHSGEEYLFVHSGTLLLYTEAYGPVRLEQGDSIYFDSAMGHAYVSGSDTPCQVISICAASGTDLLEHHRLDPPAIDRSLTMSESAMAAKVEQPIKAGSKSPRTHVMARAARARKA